jgi:nicotinate phosphoribosyltransferase
MENNNTMMTDLYELTMAQTYFNDNKLEEKVYFDGFFRNIPFENGYALMGGVDNIIKYIKNLNFTNEDINYLRGLGQFNEEFLNYLNDFKFTGDIKIVPDGTPVFANEPIVTVRANLIEAQIIETAVLSYLNSCIKFTTAAKMITDAAEGTPVMEFGARRADGPEAAVLASKCSYIAGCVGTSNVKAGKEYGIPVMGTMAHSMVTEEDSEYEAFLKYAKTYPNNCVFLVDTYDTLKSGIPNAIKVAKEYLIQNGYKLKGIRIDSGDLAYFSKEARKMLDEAGFVDTKICISNGLSAKTIKSLKDEGAIYDSIGAGDNISAPKERVGVVYKLVSKEEKNAITPKIKLSNDIAKMINPGSKRVYRFFDKQTGYALGDVVALSDEIIPSDSFTLIDPENELNTKTITNYDVKELQVQLFKDGQLVYDDPKIEEKKNYCNEQMETLYPEIRRLEKPHKYYVDLTKNLLELKKQLILTHKKEVEENYKEKVLHA